MREANKLSAVKIAKLNEPGRYADGGGLYLQVTKSTARPKKPGEAPGVTKAWLFRYMLATIPRHMGLGSLNTLSLAEARERARQARQRLLDGIDPIGEREAARAKAAAENAKRITFDEAAAKYIAAHKAGWKNAKHAGQWEQTLATYATPIIGSLSVAAIDTGHVLKVLEPIWNEKPETANRVRGRIESVLDWAKAREFRPRDSENPARWRGHLDNLLPEKSKVRQVQHHEAMAIAEIPGFMHSLRDQSSMSAKALEFTILTAVRTAETIGAKRSEFDLAAKVWTIPGERTKSGREHRVPLSARALALIASLPEMDGGEYMFPGARKGKPLSNMAMLELLRGTHPGLTVHGFRSTFRDWAGEQTNYPRELAEAALAHVLKDKTEAAYRRSDSLEKRRKLMEAWAGYCGSNPAGRGAVVPMRGRVQ